MFGARFVKGLYGGSEGGEKCDTLIFFNLAYHFDH